MKKILIVSTVSRQFYLFEQGNIEVLKSLNYEVHCAANFADESERLDGLDIIRHPFDIQRSPFSMKNIKAYNQLKNIMKTEKFDAVHCHSPMGGVLCRLAAKSLGISPVLYTAHGFHFYKNAPILNWALYYPIEKWLSNYTDVLITINEEDYSRASSFRTCKVEYIPGIGVSTDTVIENQDIRNQKREELNIPENAFLIISVGELNLNKNHQSVIRALAKIKNKDIYYIICGQGDLKDKLTNLAESLNLKENIKLLGFRNDVKDLCLSSDLFIFPSFREGLSVALMEAMVAGLPVLASNIRGNVDLIQNGEGGYLFEPNDSDEIAKRIEELFKNNTQRIRMGNYNNLEIKKYDRKIINEKMEKIYNNL